MVRPMTGASAQSLWAPIADDLRTGHRTNALVALADHLHQTTVSRVRVFGLPGTTDPGWTMLLALFVAESRGIQLAASQACRTSGVPGTTAFRCLSRLEDLKLVSRQGDRRDRRRTLVSLTDPGRQALIGSLAALHAGLARDVFG